MYTTHGHHIPGTVLDERPSSVARCGGPHLCKECKAEVEYQARKEANSYSTTTQHPSFLDIDVKEIERVKANRGLSDEEVLNRFGWHRANEVTQPRHRLIRERFAEMAVFIDTVLPPGRAKSMAQTELEACAMWANKAVAEMAPVVVETT